MRGDIVFIVGGIVVLILVYGPLDSYWKKHSDEAGNYGIGFFSIVFGAFVGIGLIISGIIMMMNRKQFK